MIDFRQYFGKLVLVTPTEGPQFYGKLKCVGGLGGMDTTTEQYNNMAQFDSYENYDDATTAKNSKVKRIIGEQCANIKIIS